MFALVILVLLPWAVLIILASLKAVWNRLSSPSTSTRLASRSSGPTSWASAPAEPKQSTSRSTMSSARSGTSIGGGDEPQE